MTPNGVARGVLKVVSAELRFPPTPRFVTQRGDFVDALAKRAQLDTWTLNEAFVQVTSSKDSSVVFQATPANVSVSLENLPPEKNRELSQAAIDVALEAFAVETATFIGVRTLWLLPASDFVALNSWMIEELGAGSRPLFDAFEGREPSDSGWVFEFRDKDPEHVLRLGPMKVEQAVQQIFRDKDEANYPEQFLFMDLDRQTKKQRPAATVRAEWTRALKSNLAVAQKLCTGLRSRT